MYSLGAVLFELLTGEPPLTKASVKDRGIRVVINCIQRQEAEHPANRVAGYDERRRTAVAADLSAELSGVCQVLR